MVAPHRILWRMLIGQGVQDVREEGEDSDGEAVVEDAKSKKKNKKAQ